MRIASRDRIGDGEQDSVDPFAGDAIAVGGIFCSRHRRCSELRYSATSQRSDIGLLLGELALRKAQSKIGT
jgi:hypothetical protein